MAPQSSDLLQGTLDLLILKTLALEPMHGWASRSEFNRSPGTCCKSGKVRSIPHCTGWNRRDGSARRGLPPTTTGAPGFIRSRPRARDSYKPSCQSGSESPAPSHSYSSGFEEDGAGCNTC